MFERIIQQSTYSTFLAFIVAPTWTLGGTRRQITGRTHAIDRIVRYALEHRQVQIADGMSAGNAVSPSISPFVNALICDHC